MDALLEPLGLGATESSIFLSLLDHPRCTLADLSAELGVPVARLRKPLDRLMESGLISRLPTSPPSFVPVSPEVGIDALALRRQEELERLRIHARELARRMADSPRGSSGDLIELIDGDQAVLHHLSRLQSSAREEVSIVDCPPYLFGTPVDNEEQAPGMRRGVRYRAIYHAPVLDLPGKLDNVLRCIADGEQARVLPEVNLKMLIADRRAAIIPLRFSQTETGVRILVHPSPLLSALIACFDLLWEKATPLGEPPQPDGPDEQDRRLLAMLAAGMKDRAVSRALGVTERTVTRRVTALMGRLGAQTRFQAALQAARRGWL